MRNISGGDATFYHFRVATVLYNDGNGFLLGGRDGAIYID